MTRDFYAESDAAAEELRSAGRPENALAIRDAIAGGATSSEILMDLRAEFDQVLKRGPLPSELEARVRDLRAAVSQALQQYSILVLSDCFQL